MNEEPATPEERLRAYHELVAAALHFGGKSRGRKLEMALGGAYGALVAPRGAARSAA